MQPSDIINKHKSIIILNGEPPHQNLIDAINTKVPIIAADGAANKLGSYGLMPTFIVGDGDSYQHPKQAVMLKPAWFDPSSHKATTDRYSGRIVLPARRSFTRRRECARSACIEGSACFDRAQHKTFGSNMMSKHPGLSLPKAHHERAPTIVRIPDQNSTDFEKCIGFAQQSNLLPSLILGINGGEIDHIIGNMQMLVRHANRQNLYFLDTYTKPQTQDIGVKLGLPLGRQKLTLHLKVGCTISFMSFHETVVQTEGLEWELNDRLLSLDGTLSLRNRSKQEQVSFELKSGKALVVIDLTEICIEDRITVIKTFGC